MRPLMRLTGLVAAPFAMRLRRVTSRPILDFSAGGITIQLMTVVASVILALAATHGGMQLSHLRIGASVWSEAMAVPTFWAWPMPMLRLLLWFSGLPWLTVLPGPIILRLAVP